jgi:hypothetical protein
MRMFMAAAALLSIGLAHSDRAIPSTADSWRSLAFLEGTWEARTRAGSSQAVSSGDVHVQPGAQTSCARAP